MQPYGGLPTRAAAPRAAEATSPRFFTRWVGNCRLVAPMRKHTKPLPTESPLLFEVDPQPIEETLTALGGIPLVVQAFRSLGLPQSVQEHVRVKARERGYDEATFVESFVILNAAGGECPEDFKRLRADPGLVEMIGHELPSPAAALQFLYAFHAKEKVEEAKQRRLPEQIAYIPEETRPLEGLGRVNRDLVQRCGERCPDQRIATVDQDATIIESHKQQAFRTYEGVRGYQPLLAVWAGGGDRSGAGGAVSRRQCAGADGAVGSRAASLCRPARHGERVLLSGRFGLSRKPPGELVAR